MQNYKNNLDADNKYYGPKWEYYISFFLALLLFYIKDSPEWEYPLLVIIYSLAQIFLLRTRDYTTNIISLALNFTLFSLYSCFQIWYFDTTILKKIVLFFIPNFILWLAHLNPKILKFPEDYRERYDLWLYFGLIYLISAVFLLFYQVSNFLPSALYLIGGLFCYSNLSEYLKRVRLVNYSTMRLAFFNSGHSLLIAFIICHLTINITSQNNIFDFISLRLILGTLGIVVACLSFYEGKEMQNKFIASNNNDFTGNFFNKTATAGLEVSILLTLLTISLEIPIYYQGIAFSLLVLSLICLKYYTNLLPNRAVTYIWILFSLTSAHIAVVTSSWNSPIQSWYSSTHLSGVSSLVLQLISVNLYVVNLDKTKGSFIQQNVKLQNLYFPIMFYLTAGLFLFWRFEAAYLTILWVALSLFMLISALYWRNNKLANISFGAIGICAVRLIFFDLAQTELFIRACVVMGVGVMMLLSNIFFNAFKKRLS